MNDFFAVGCFFFLDSEWRKNGKSADGKKAKIQGKSIYMSIITRTEKRKEKKTETYILCWTHPKMMDETHVLEIKWIHGDKQSILRSGILSIWKCIHIITYI